MDLNTILIYCCFIILFLIINLFLLKSNTDIRHLTDIFKPRKPTLNFNVDKERLQELSAEISHLNIEEKLFILRSLLGSSYRAAVWVNGAGIGIDGLGNYADIADEESECITG